MANPVASIILTAVDKTKAVFTSVKSGIDSIGERARALGMIFTGLGSLVSLAGLVGAVKQTANEMDETRKSAQAAGTSVEKFSALSYAAGQSGVKNLTDYLSKLAIALRDAREGTGPAASAFRALDLDPTQFEDASDALVVLADRFAAMPDGVNKTTLATKLFGEAGIKLIPFLNQGSAAVRELMTEAGRLGVVLDEETSKAAERFNDELDKMGKRAKGARNDLVEFLLPSLAEYVAAANDVLDKGSALDKLAFFGAGIISAETLDRIREGSERVAEYNEKIAKLQTELKNFRSEEERTGFFNPNIETWETRIAALQKARDAILTREKNANKERENSSGDTSDAIIKDYQEESKAFSRSVTERISDAERLGAALNSAFTNARNDEKRYREEANRLNARAGGGLVGNKDQESLEADAAIAALKLDRLKGSGSVDEIRAQTEAVRELSNAIDDQAMRKNLLIQADQAEAVAANKAADAASQQASELAEQMRANDARAAEFRKTADEINKPVALDIVTTQQAETALNKLREAKRLIEYINANPLQISATGSSNVADVLRQTALQHGNRR